MYILLQFAIIMNPFTPQLSNCCFDFLKAREMRHTALQTLSQDQVAEPEKRPITVLQTPSPAHKKQRDSHRVSDPADPVEDHGYAATPISVAAQESRRSVRRTLLQCHDEKHKISDIIKDSVSLQDLCTNIMNNSESRKVVQEMLVGEMDNQLSSLCNHGEFGTVLSPKKKNSWNSQNSQNKVIEAALKELQQRVPLLFTILVVASSSSDSIHLYRSDQSQMPHLFSLYGIIMHERSTHMTGFQQIMTSACLRYHSGNGVSTTSYIVHLVIVNRNKKTEKK